MLLTKQQAYLLALPIGLILMGYVVFPSLQTVFTSWKWENYTTFFSGIRSANVQALYNSVSLSLLTVLSTGIIGTALAYLFYRFQFPLKRILMALVAMPLALPPLVGVMAFLFLYGESGILPRGIQQLFGLTTVPFAFEGFSAVWLVHTYVMYVYFYLFVMAALRNLDSSLLEASNDLGAKGFYTFIHVVLPLLRPALISASLLVFMISMASFTAPLLFDGSGRYLTTQIYNYKTNGNLELSATVATVLTFISIIFLMFVEFRQQRNATPQASKGTASALQTIQNGWLRNLSFLIAVGFIVFILLPILTIFLISFAEEGSWTFQLLPERYTFANYIALFNDADFSTPILNSLQLATLATVSNILFGVFVAILIVKTQIIGKDLLRLMTMLPFAIPGTVIAVNLIITFSQPSILSFGQLWVGSFWILPLAYFIRHIPLVVRATSTALENYDDKLTEASHDLGATRITTFLRVMLPIILPAILAGTLLTFVTALGEFVSSIMLYIVDNRPISVEILSQLRLYNFGAAAAYSVFLMVLIGLATLAIRRIGGNTETAL